jgi:hypothetical protein
MHCVTIPSDVKSAIRPALGVLAETLTDRHYSAFAATRIVAYVASEGTVTGAPGMEPEDEAAAEFAFVSALEPVPFDDARWGEDLDVESGCEPLPELPDLRDPHDWCHPALRAAGIPPVSGGAPGRLDGDVRDFEEWLDQVDQPYPPADQPVDRHSPRMLEQLHLALYGQREPFHA